MTTDTSKRPPLRDWKSTAREIRLAAMCKGSGMIHPQLVPHATMLVYILTDAAIGRPCWMDTCVKPSKSASTAFPWMATLRQMTPCCYWPREPAA